MEKTNKALRAFTLVELIVVITILAILWTISFIAFQWYTGYARNAVRTSDLKNIEKVIELLYVSAWIYPSPSDSVDITYSWATLWKQWTFWQSSLVQAWSKLSKLPKDSLTWNEYSYSVTDNGREYQLSYTLEWWTISQNNVFINQAMAWDLESIAYDLWNYNWLMLSVSTWWVDYVLSVPSIISSDLSITDYVSLVDNKKLVYEWFSNLADSYSWSRFKTDWWFDLSLSNVVLYSWNLSDLDDVWQQVLLLKNIQEAYSWTVLESEDSSIREIVNREINTEDPSSISKILACDIINFKLRYFVECWNVNFITYYVSSVLNIDLWNIPWWSIKAVYQTTDWNYWFWTDEWLALLDTSTNSWTYFTTDDWLLHNEVLWITEGPDETIWIWTNLWISVYDQWWSPEWTSITVDSTDWWLLHNKILNITTAADWTIWIWTNNWISSFDSWTWDSYTKKNNWLSSDHVKSIFEASDWSVWFWTDNKWVDKFFSDTVTNYDSGDWKVVDNHIQYIYEDSNNDMRFWTVWWLTHFDVDTEIWTHYTTSNWLIWNDITYIYEDSQNNIWVWTTSWATKITFSPSLDFTDYSTSTSTALSWNNIFSIYEDNSGDILILNDWGLDTISD